MIIILVSETRSRLDSQSNLQLKIRMDLNLLLTIEQLQQKKKLRRVRFLMKKNKIQLLIRKEIFSFSSKLFQTLSKSKLVHFGNKGLIKCLIIELSSL
jgi:hypothetical protein